MTAENMRWRAAPLLLALVCFTLPAQADGRTEVIATITKYVSGVDKNDLKAERETFVDTPYIVDEFPPFTWSGKNSFERWTSEWKTYADQHDIHGTGMTLNAVKQVLIEGSNAYAIVNVSGSYTAKDGKHKESGTFIFTLQKKDKAWKISSTTWAAH